MDKTRPESIHLACRRGGVLIARAADPRRRASIARKVRTPAAPGHRPDAMTALPVHAIATPVRKAAAPVGAANQAAVASPATASPAAAPPRSVTVSPAGPVSLLDPGSVGRRSGVCRRTLRLKIGKVQCPCNRRSVRRADRQACQCCGSRNTDEAVQKRTSVHQSSPCVSQSTIQVRQTCPPPSHFLAGAAYCSLPKLRHDATRGRDRRPLRLEHTSMSGQEPRRPTTIAVTICVTSSGAMLRARMTAHIVLEGGVRCMTSAIGGR